MDSSTLAGPSPGPFYTPSQMQEYFKRIHLPQEWVTHPICAEARPPDTLSHLQALEFLFLLQSHQISSVPFENLHLHYSTHRSIKIDPESVFNKIVKTRNGRGGYCMEVNTLFWVVMRTLGYQVYPTGARINTSVRPSNDGEAVVRGAYMGWRHMVSIVEISGTRYLVDVGFGTNGPHHPINLSGVHSRCEAQLHRVRRGPIPELTTDSRQQLYVYESSLQPPSTAADEIKWIPAYCFTDTEFTTADFDVMNYFTSTSPHSFFTKSIICVKVLLKNGHLAGDISMFDDGESQEHVVKYRQMEDGQLVTVKKVHLTSEKERVMVLEDMGVILTIDEQNGIRGTALELLIPGKKMSSLSCET